MDHEHIAADLAKALRFVLEVEKSMTFGQAWSDSRKAAWDVLERYQAQGPDLASELLRVCRKVLHVIETSRMPMPLSLGVAVRDMQAVINTIEQQSVAAVARRRR